MVTPVTTPEQSIPEAAPLETIPVVADSSAAPASDTNQLRQAQRQGQPGPEIRKAPSSEVHALRRQVAELHAAKQTTEIEAFLRAEANQAHQEALQRGFAEEDARWVAQRHYTVTRRAIEQQQNLVAQHEFRLGQQNAARQIGEEYGVDPRLLIRATTPTEMYAIAQREKAFAQTENRLKTLEQGRVPAQEFNQSPGSRAGNIVATNANIDKLWMDWETAHSSQPGQVNPYEAQYRKLVRG